MNLKSRTTAGAINILELSGRFDAYEVPLIKEKLREMAHQHPAHVVINLGQVNFADSSALAAMVQGMKHCRENNGDLHLCQLQQPVRIIFELTRLDKAMEIYPTTVEAVASLMH